MFQFRSISEGKNKNPWMCPPTWKFGFTRPLIRIGYTLTTKSPQAALRVAESIATAKMLKKKSKLSKHLP